ncbi:MAG: type IV secretory system conjugative DNA transfer family protein [Bacteroidales bacterium]
MIDYNFIFKYLGIALINALFPFIFHKSNLLFPGAAITSIGAFVFYGYTIQAGDWLDALIYTLVVLVIMFVTDELINQLFNKKKQADNWRRVELLDDRKRKHYIEDLNRGVAIFGSSGSGKTASVIESIGKHFAANKMVGIINDYKDYELTEVLYPVFRKENINFNVFAIHDIERSVRINVIHPDIIKTTTKLNGVVASLVQNLSQSDADGGTEKFFRDGAESLLTGVIWRLKKDYPEYCNLPFVISLLLSTENHHEQVVQPNGTILTKPYQKLIKFINEDDEAAILGAVFLSGVSNERQTASLYSTLAASLRLLASREIYYLLSAHDISLDINNEDNRMVLSFVNKPGDLDNVISPINAMIIEACFSAMSERNRQPSFILLDEAPTIKIMGLKTRIATLRSYGVSFVYCMQDKIQGVGQWGGKEYKMKEILTNLSTQFMGKVNDADTAKYYEQFFEIIENDTRSVSKSASFLDMASARITTSKKERAKVRANEFQRLKQGEFIMFSDGRDDRFRFFYEPGEKALPPKLREVPEEVLEDNYRDILHKAKVFFENHF